MKRLGVFLLSSGWDVNLSYIRGLIPSIKFASTRLYTWVERSTERVKCPVKEHNTMSMACRGLEPAPLDLESSTLTRQGYYTFTNEFIAVVPFCCFHCRGESCPDKQESPETKSKKGPEGTENFSCIFAGVFLFLDNESQSTSVMSLCCRPSLTSDDRQRVLRWACLI